MKIGDMVVRAYAFHDFIPGIIVDESIVHHPQKDGEVEWVDHQWIIHWSDGVLSKEMSEELDYLEDVIQYAT